MIPLKRESEDCIVISITIKRGHDSGGHAAKQDNMANDLQSTKSKRPSGPTGCREGQTGRATGYIRSSLADSAKGVEGIDYD